MNGELSTQRFAACRFFYSNLFLLLLFEQGVHFGLRSTEVQLPGGSVEFDGLDFVHLGEVQQRLGVGSVPVGVHELVRERVLGCDRFLHHVVEIFHHEGIRLDVHVFVVHDVPLEGG